MTHFLSHNIESFKMIQEQEIFHYDHSKNLCVYFIYVILKNFLIHMLFNNFFLDIYSDEQLGIFFFKPFINFNRKNLLKNVDSFL